MIADRIRRLHQETGLLPSGRIVVAVSGGADSITLLHALISLRDELHLDLHVATLDHGLRGQASADDAGFVQTLAERWGVPCTAAHVDVPALLHTGREKNLEAVARRARYEFLAQVARQVGAHTIATGHNLDDQVETVLMHLLRGTGLAGLRGMQPSTPLSTLKLGLPFATDDLLLVRPLLTTPRHEIDDYIQVLGLTPRHDATNDDPVYTRNRLRHDLLPLLEQIAPNFREAVGRMASLVSADYAALLSTLPALDADHSLSRADFLALHPAQQRHLLYQHYQRLSPTAESALDSDALHDIQRFIVEAPANASYNNWLHLKHGRVYFYTELPYPSSAPRLAADTEMIITSPVTRLAEGWKFLLNAPATDLSSPLCARLTLPPNAQLALRTPRRGDRYQPAGLHGQSQKLSDTFINLKVPQAWRSQIPLLMVNGEIAWFVVPLPTGLRARLADPFRPSTLKNGESTVNICFAQVIVQ